MEKRKRNNLLYEFPISILFGVFLMLSVVGSLLECLNQTFCFMPELIEYSFFIFIFMAEYVGHLRGVLGYYGKKE